MRLRYYQEDAISNVEKALSRVRSTLVQLPTGCHDPEQLVLKHDGALVRACDVKKGDLLMGPDSQPREVVRLVNGVAPMVRIRPVKGQPFVVTADHLVTCARTNCTSREAAQSRLGDPLFELPAARWFDLSAYQRHCVKIVRSSAVDFERATPLPIEPYFLGVLLGDGGLARLGSVDVTTMDPEILTELHRQASLWGLFVRATGSNSGRATTWGLRTFLRGRGKRNPLVVALAALGLNPIACHDRFIPTLYLSTSRAQRLELLAGLMDTDGHATEGGTFDYVSLSPRLAQGVTFLARSLGLAAYQSLKIIDAGTYHRVSISGDCSDVPCRLPRKQHRPRAQKKDHRRTGFNVELLDGDREYFGWSVDGTDRRYLLEDFTITHNCGKTVVFNDLARRYAESHRRTLILAHREELIFQAAAALEAVTGIKAAIEKAERAEAHEVMPLLLEAGAPGVGPDGKSLVVVASVQSMVRRLDKFKPDHFDLLVIDECHHAPAKTYRDIIDHFAPAKVLGVSATPERSDQVALGSIFDDVAFQYEIADGIEDGWLVPIHQQVVKTEHLDLSKVRTTAGDLNLGDLEAAMTQTDLLHEIAGPAVELAGDRQGIVFAVTVEHAYLLGEALREQIVDRWRKLGRGAPPANIVVALDGTTDVEERREALESFRRGEIQFLVNCALFVEGTDLPSIGVVVMAAPTKSRSRYAQMIGRGTRPLPRIVDAFPGRDQAPQRRSAIALSEKTHCLIIDFTENSGKHKLVSATDLLAGKYSEPELAMAKAMLARHEVKDILEALRRARAKIKEMESLRAQARKGFSAITVDPFDPTDTPEQAESRPPRISEKQRRALVDYGVENADRLDTVEASALLKTVAERKAANLADFNQIRTLMRKGGIRSERAVGLTFVEAAEYIAKLAKNGWRRPPSWDIKFGPAEYQKKA